MDMCQAVDTAHLYTEWGQFAKLPDPTYATVSISGGKAYVAYQFSEVNHVHAWAQSLTLTPGMQAHDGKLWTRAILRSEAHDVEFYACADLPKLPTPPSYAATP